MATTQPTSAIKSPQDNNRDPINKEEEIDLLTNNLPKKDKEVFLQTLQELNEFRATLNEEELAKLEKRISELKLPLGLQKTHRSRETAAPSKCKP